MRSPWGSALAGAVAIACFSITWLAWPLSSPRLEEFTACQFTVKSKDGPLIVNQSSEMIRDNRKSLLAQAEGFQATLELKVENACLEAKQAQPQLSNDPCNPKKKSSQNSQISQSIDPASICPTTITHRPCTEPNYECSNKISLQTKGPDRLLELRLKPLAVSKNEKGQLNLNRLNLLVSFLGSPMEAVLDTEQPRGVNCVRKLWLGNNQVIPSSKVNIVTKPAEKPVATTSQATVTFEIERGVSPEDVQEILKEEGVKCSERVEEETLPQPFSVSPENPLMARSLKVDKSGGDPLLAVENPEGKPPVRIERLELAPGLLRVRISGEGEMAGPWAPSRFKMLVKERLGTSIVSAGGFAIGSLALAACLLWLSSWKQEQEPAIDSKPADSGRRVQVFVSYAKKDRAYTKGTSLLGTLKESDELYFWSDARLNHGELWDKRIQSELEKSDIILALVSEHFLRSKYCMDVEIPSFLKASKPIFPVMLRRCKWRKYEWLHDWPRFPKDDKTIENDFTDPMEREILFESIQRALEKKAKSIREARDQEARSSLPPPPGEPSKTVDDAGP